MHVATLDGPGIGQSNIRGIKLTSDNFEDASRVFLDHLSTRDEVDEDKIALYALGFGSFWGLRLCASDDRIKAAATHSSYADKYYLLNEDGPRWKQLFAYLTHSSTEEELDAVMSAMTLDGYLERIDCPVLMSSGEYNHRDPIEEVFALFDQLTAPAELWVFADQFQQIALPSGRSTEDLMYDWLVDRLEGRPMRNAGEVLYIEPNGPDPDDPLVERKRRWYETSR
jgi:cephalosporin-C deacetylase-like acetyl esterase